VKGKEGLRNGGWRSLGSLGLACPVNVMHMSNACVTIERNLEVFPDVLQAFLDAVHTIERKCFMMLW
jgi:hypothetical protein